MSLDDYVPEVPDDTASTSWDHACLHLLSLMHGSALQTDTGAIVPDIHRYVSRGCPSRLLAAMWRWHLDTTDDIKQRAG